ncbi:MAG: hypothetical protein JXK16_02945 [Thiotrichales bacterium]|nr:hypothetical protein [Thiotrichales bacterium]
MESILKTSPGSPGKYILRLIEDGERVFKEGLPSLSRKQVANLVGVKQLTLFDRNPPKLTFIACGLLSRLTEKNLHKMVGFSDALHGKDYVPGCLSESQFLNLAKETRLGEETLGYARSILVGGLTLDSIGVPSPKRDKVLQGCAAIYSADPTVTERYTATFIDFLEADLGLTKITNRFLLQVLASTSKRYIDSLRSDSVRHHISIFFLARIIILSNKSDLIGIESDIYELLSTIESFKHRKNVFINRLYPFINPETGCNKAPPWVSFLDHSEMSETPSIPEMIQLYNLVKSLDKKPVDKVRAEYRAICGASKKMGIFDFQKAHDLITNEGLTIGAAHQRLQPETDGSIFNRSYKIWRSGHRYTPYWEF